MTITEGDFIYDNEDNNFAAPALRLSASLMPPQSAVASAATPLSPSSSVQPADASDNAGTLVEPYGTSPAVRTLTSGPTSDAVFSPDGRTLYASNGGVVTSYDVASGQILTSWTVGSSLGGMDITPDGGRLVVTEQTPLAQEIINNETRTTIGVHVLDLASGAVSTYSTVVGYLQAPFYDVSVLTNGDAVLTEHFYGSGSTPLFTLDLDSGNLSQSTRWYPQTGVLTRNFDHSLTLLGPQNISDAPLHVLNGSGTIVASHESYADNVVGYNRGVQAIGSGGGFVAQFLYNQFNIYNTSLNFNSDLRPRYPELQDIVGMSFSPADDVLYVLDSRSDSVFALSTTNFSVVGAYWTGTDITASNIPISSKFGDRLMVSADGNLLSVIGDNSLQIINLALVPLIGSSSNDDVIAGNPGNTVIYGFSGNDVIRDLDGEDSLYGGAGNDLYYVNSSGDWVYERPNDGYDRVVTTVSMYIPANVEELVVADGYAADLRGSSGADKLIGNSGNDHFFGSGGGDTLIGNGGNDTYEDVDYYDAVIESVGGGPRDTVYVSGSYQLAAGQEVEVISAEKLPVWIIVDQLVGNEFRNEVVGNDGFNTIDGRGGADVMRGLGGDDIYYADNPLDLVIERAGEGSRDLVYTRGDFTLFAGQEVEILSADWNAGTAHLTLVGNELDNEIVGNNGINEIFGGDGTDRLVGLGGDDIYHVDGPEDWVFEGAGQGARDLVYAPGSYTLLSGQEIEVLSPDWNGGTAPMNMIGNEFANEIYGNDGANTIDGGAGADALIGLGGADVYSFATAPDGTTNIDTIYGYVSGQDSIALDHDVFAGLTVGALAASAFVTGTAAADADDRIIFDPTAATLAFDPDGNGAAPAMVFAVFAGGAPPVTAADIAVV